MDILRISIKEQPLIKYYMIKLLIMLKIQNMMNINTDLLQRFINLFDKKNSNINTETKQKN